MAVITYYKNYTETLSEMLDRFRYDFPEYQHSKITYAGRLDPMAEGLMIILTDSDVNYKDKYIQLDKIYTVECVFGPSTDSLDVLGCIDVKHSRNLKEINKETIITGLKKISLLKNLEYPVYSSKTVKGKPLWQYAREDLLHTISIPSREIYIHNADYISTKTLPLSEFYQKIKQNIQSVNADFRQDKVLKSWNSYLVDISNKNIQIHTLRFNVSSGTYIRSLVHQLGSCVGIPAISIKIQRIQIGDNKLT